MKKKLFTLTYCCTVLCFMGVMALTGCAVFETAKAAKAERLALTKGQIEDGLASRQYTIDIERAQPQVSFSDISLVSSYPPGEFISSGSVTVFGDTLKSDLPYLGNAYSLPYGGGNGLRFKAPITNYTMDNSHKDRQTIYIEAADLEDTYRYIITLFDNGSASINVMPRKRSSIEFTGKYRVN